MTPLQWRIFISLAVAAAFAWGLGWAASAGRESAWPPASTLASTTTQTTQVPTTAARVPRVVGTETGAGPRGDGTAPVSSTSTSTTVRARPAPTSSTAPPTTAARVTSTSTTTTTTPPTSTPSTSLPPATGGA